MATRFMVGAYDAGLTDLTLEADRCAPGRAEPQLSNVSWGVCAADGTFYFVDEADGRVTAARREGEAWRLLGGVASGGEAPCFLDLDGTGRRLAVANYKSGHVAVLRLDAVSGRLEEPPSADRDKGSGPDPDRQEGPHAHCARFRHGCLYAADLGADAVFLRRIDGAGRLGPARLAFAAPAGEGPRQLLFHPRLPVAYVLSELGSRLFVLAIAPGGLLVEVERLSTLPSGFGGRSLGGHLAMSPDGAWLYASNRGHDSLAAFSVKGDGRLALRQIAPTFGKGPRFFLLAEDLDRVLVAHEEDGGVVALELEGGRLGGERGRAEIAKAAWIGRA